MSGKLSRVGTRLPEYSMPSKRVEQDYVRQPMVQWPPVRPIEDRL
jgi:hypothetical protein